MGLSTYRSESLVSDFHLTAVLFVELVKLTVLTADVLIEGWDIVVNHVTVEQGNILSR